MNKIIKQFPFLEAIGTPSDIGRTIGQTFRRKIQNSVEFRKATIPNYDKYLEQTKPYFEITNNYFPHLISELDSMATAAGVSLEDLFFINNREVYDSMEVIDHCTIAVSFGKNGSVVGHNEDWSISALDDLYILKATIGETTFLGLQYFEALGVSATMNNWGLVQCINDLSAGSQIGVPKNFIARAVLECKSLDEAEDLIRKTPCASGFNHVLVQNDEVRNIEISGNLIAVEKVYGQPYVHTNHFLSPVMINQPQIVSPSSHPRFERAREIVKYDMTREDMIALLSDKKNTEFPICRNNETIGSVICLPQLKEVWVCYGHPCVGEFVKYSF